MAVGVGGAAPVLSPITPTDKGSNCCFMAEAYLVETAEETSGRMCVNTEWGCFGDDGTLNDVFTPYDVSVDEESSNPGVKRCSFSPRKDMAFRAPHLSLSMSGPTNRSTYSPAMLLGALKGPRGAAREA